MSFSFFGGRWGCVWVLLIKNPACSFSSALPGGRYLVETIPVALTDPYRFIGMMTVLMFIKMINVLFCFSSTAGAGHAVVKWTSMELN